MPFPKPTVAISQCLLDQLSDELSKHWNVIAICPKKTIGYPMGDKEFYEEYGESVELNDFAKNFIKDYPSIQGFVLKCHHPVKEPLHVASFGALSPLLKKYKDSLYSDEDVFLNDMKWDNLLSKLYCLEAFDVIRNTRDFEQLVTFHQDNKFLLRLFDASSYDMLNSLIQSNQEDVFLLYEQILKRVFNKDYTKEDYKAIAVEMMIYYKDYINLKEQAFIKELLEDYDANLVSQIIIEYLLKNNLLRFNIHQVYNQSFFSRYPKELAAIGQLMKQNKTE